MKALRNEEGTVLLLVLVVVALLTSLLTEFAFSTLVDLRLTETFRDSTKAYYLAKGGVRAGRIILQNDRNGYDARNDPEELWSQGMGTFPVGGGSVSVTIEDLGGRLDLNRLVLSDGINPNPAAIDRLLRLFEILEIEEGEDLTAALIDWIDEDEEIYDLRGYGAEDEHYLRLDPPYPTKNGSLSTLGELARVRGFTPEVIGLVTPHITVYGGEKINVNTASAQVLMSLSEDPLIDEAAAEAIIELRESKPFRSSQDLKGLNSLPGLENLLRDPFTVKSDTYRITTEAWVNDGSREVDAIVTKDGDKLLFVKVN
ncbi:type II secretion system minor pseudopilin GspK [Desulfuromonas sp.]|uniref:type II secretion system minor pseudopilin GspK n=1 Tax=Desulfuromonas sp. TaxID=892 RepID=UPI0025BDBF3F|nr:type II secretion system minor pseudopilin GspK [Desulfuromonas sp.]